MLPGNGKRIASAMFALIIASTVLVRIALADGTGYFTAEQAEEGRLAYAQDCATCHGASLQGVGAPPLAGHTFEMMWSGKTLQDLFGYVHRQMPLGRAGSLRDQTYTHIVAYILSENGIAAGNERLTPTTPMQRALVFGAAGANADQKHRSSDEQDQHQEAGAQRRGIVGAHRVEDQSPEPRQREGRFDDHRAGDEGGRV